MWNKISDYLSENIVITNTFLILILILGVICGLSLKRDIAPFVESNAVIIRATYPGASAEEVEQKILIPLENSIQQLNSIPTYTSFANENFGYIKAVFRGEKSVAVLKELKQEFIRSAQNTSGLPVDARIAFSEEGAQSIPMYIFALYNNTNSTLSDLEFQDFVSKIILQNKEIKGVAQVDTSGTLEEAIHIDVDFNKIEQKYVSLFEIVQAIRLRNIKLSAGFIDLGLESKKLITDGGYQNPLDVKDTIIRSSFENQRIRIKDIAQVTNELEDTKIDVKINGGSAVIFGLVMKENENINKVTKSINNAIESYKEQLPKGIELVLIEKRFEAVDTILNLTQISTLLGILIVFIILLLVLDWRTAFWTTLGIPVTIALSIIYMYFTDMSINMVSLCAIITVLGMLVDHGIVISENIHQYRLLGEPPLKAVKKGIKDVFAPVIVTVITTIAAFMPLTMVGDTLGGLIRPLPIIISVALLFSFFEAMFILPAHLSHIPIQAISKEKSEKKWILFLEKKYVSVLKISLHHRYKIVILFVAILIGTGFLGKIMFKDFIFMEDIGTNSLFVNMEGGGGTSFEHMQGLVAEVEQIVKSTLSSDEYTAIKTETGRFDILSLWNRGAQPNRGQVAIYLQPNYYTGRTPKQILDKIRNTLDTNSITTNFTRLFFESNGLLPKIKNAITLQFHQKSQGNNDYILMMQDIYQYISSLPGLVNLAYTSTKGEDQLIIVFNYEKAAQLGMDVKTVSETVKIAAGGLVASQWKSDNKEVSYIIRLDPKQRNSIQTIENLLIPNKFYRLIRLKEFASLEEREGTPDIYRAQGAKMVQISMDVDRENNTINQVVQNVKTYEQLIAHKYPDAKMVLDGEAADIADSFEDFKIAGIIALILIYMILLGLFKSLIQPFIVILIIPFGIVGAIWAFYVHGQVLSFMSIVGIIGLMGVVVNDAVVMVEFINKVVRSHPAKSHIIQSIMEGAQKRFKAVLLTTITTAAGLFPAIYGLQGIADLIVPIATAMAYGLIFATVVTLIFIPVVYLIGLDVKYFIQRLNKNNKRDMQVS